MSAIAYSGDAVPVLLCFEGELQHHRQRTLPREGTLHPLGAVTQGGERGLDGIRGADVDPVLGWKVIRGEQRVTVLRETVHGPRVFGAIFLVEESHRRFGRDPALGHPDLVQIDLGLSLGLRGQVVEYVARLVHPTALVTCRGEHLANRTLETEGSVANGELGGVQTPALRVEQQLPPT